MVGVPWLYTTAEYEEFAEKPNNGRFISSQNSCLLDFDVRHAFWRFDAIAFRLLEDNSTAVDLICSHLVLVVIALLFGVRASGIRRNALQREREKYSFGI